MSGLEGVGPFIHQVRPLQVVGARYVSGPLVASGVLPSVFSQAPHIPDNNIRVLVRLLEAVGRDQQRGIRVWA